MNTSTKLAAMLALAFAVSTIGCAGSTEEENESDSEAVKVQLQHPETLPKGRLCQLYNSLDADGQANMTAHTKELVRIDCTG